VKLTSTILLVATSLAAAAGATFAQSAPTAVADAENSRHFFAAEALKDHNSRGVSLSHP